jgi:hypothetical protein
MQLLVVLRPGYQLYNATSGPQNVVGSSKKGGLCIQLNRQKYINPIDDLTKDVFVPKKIEKNIYFYLDFLILSRQNTDKIWIE